MDHFKILKVLAGVLSIVLVVLWCTVGQSAKEEGFRVRRVPPPPLPKPTPTAERLHASGSRPRIHSIAPTASPTVLLNVTISSDVPTVNVVRNNTE